MKNIFLILFLFFAKNLFAQDCYNKTVKTIDVSLKNHINDYYLSTIEKGKIWLTYSGQPKSESYELDVNSYEMIPLSTKFGAKSAIILRSWTFIDSLDHSFWFVSDSLYRYDLTTKKSYAYLTMYDAKDYLVTANNIFFIGNKNIFVYKKKEKKMDIIYENAPFSLNWLYLNPENGFIYVNRSTYIVEDTYSMHYCTDDLMPRFERNHTKFQPKYSSVKDKVHQNNIPNFNEQRHFDDEKGCWSYDADKNIYYTNFEQNQSFIYKNQDLLSFGNRKVVSDECNIYEYLEYKKQFRIIPKQLLISKMETFDVALFKNEERICDSLLRALGNGFYEKKQSFQDYEKAYNVVKNRFENSHNFTLKAKIIREAQNKATWNNDGSSTLFLRTMTEVAEKGELSSDFQIFCPVFIRKMVLEGKVLTAHSLYKKYLKFYPNAFNIGSNFDSIQFFKLDKLAKKLYRNEVKIKTPDSLLWAKYNAIDDFCNNSDWFDDECGINDRISISVLTEFKDKFPQSPLIDLVEYTYIDKTKIRGCCSPPNFQQKQINIFDDFLKKYPQSKYINNILELEMLHYTHSKVTSISIYQAHLKKALTIAKQLKKEKYKFRYEDNYIDNFEKEIEILSWKYEIKLSKSIYAKNEPIIYTIKLKNTGKKAKELPATDCDKQPLIHFALSKNNQYASEYYGDFSFCQVLEPPKCPQSTIIFRPNEEKTFTGTLDNISFYGGVKGTVKFLKSGVFGLDISPFENGFFEEYVSKYYVDGSNVSFTILE